MSTRLIQIYSGGVPHALLSSKHSDTTPAAVARGAVVTGQGATPAWALLSLGASGTILTSNGTDIVYSTATFPNTVTAGSVLFATGTNAIGENNANFFWDNTNIRLGIGTASPSVRGVFSGADANNQVGAAVNAALRIVNTDIGAGGRTEEIQFGSSVATLFASIGGAVSDASNNTLGDIVFSTRSAPNTTANLAERMRILGSTTAGRVGIGTSSPGSLLHVVGPITVATTSQTANFTLGETQAVVFMDATAGALTVTLPAASASTIGRMYYVYKIDSSVNGVTVSAQPGQTIVGNTVAITTQWQLGFVIGQTATQWIIRKI